MDTLQYLLGGFAVALTPENLMVAAIGALIGTIVGMLPGLGPINGVAILMPLAFAVKLPPETRIRCVPRNRSPVNSLTPPAGMARSAPTTRLLSSESGGGACVPGAESRLA